MSEYYYGKIRARNTASAAGTNAAFSATQTAPTGNRKLTCTGIQCSGDTACLVTIESPSGTVLWRKRSNTTNWTMSESFAPGTVVGAAAQAMLVKISASTSNSEANIQTYEVVG